MSLKPLLKELGLLVLLFAITWLVCYLILKPEHGTRLTIDFNSNDTYFVVKNQSISLPCLLLLTPIYFIRSTITKYRNSSLNLVALGIFTLALIQIMYLMVTIGRLFLPLHNLLLSPDIVQRQEMKPLKDYDDFLNPIQIILMTTAILLVIILVISAFLTGKNWRPAYDARKI